MKNVFAIVCVVCVLVLPCAFLVSADEGQDTATVVYQQWNNGTLQLASQSPAHYGNINSGNTVWAINYIGALTSVQTGTFYPDTITVDVSSDLIRQGNAVVYMGIYNAWTLFMGSTDYNTYFEWVDSVPGYRYKGGVSTSMGFATVGQISANGPSSPSVAVRRMASGASGGSSLGNVTPLVSRTPNQHYVTHEASNGNSSQPSWVVASNSFNIYKVTVDSSSEERDTIRFTLDSNDITSVTSSLSQSGTHLISGVFVPISIVINTSGYNDSALSKLDDIISVLGDILSTNTDIATIISTNFSNIVSILGTPSDSRDTIISNLHSLLLQLSNLNNKLNPVTGGIAPQFASSIQYIEYYLSQVLADTNTIAQYVAEISATVSQISQVLDDTNDALENIDATVEDAHEQEEAIFDEATQAINNELIDGFSFGQDVGLGTARAGLDFKALWDAIGPWNQIFMFSMLLTYAFTMIRFVSVRSRWYPSYSEYRDGLNGRDN